MSLRQDMIDSGALLENEDGHILTQDYPFSAISPATQVFSGMTIDAKSALKNKDGATFREWENAQNPQGT